MAERARPATPRRLAWPVAIVLLAGLLLWFVVAVTSAGIFRSSKPEWALRLAAFDARAKASLSQNILVRSRNAPPDARASARGLALAALRRDATAVTAVTTLGFLAALDGDRARADRLFRFAERLTRRDPASQLWLIEQHVSRNDIGGALAQYDKALRGSSSLRAQLYPILVAASSDPAIARPLNRMLRGRPNWWAEFITKFIAETPDAEALATLPEGLLDPRNRDQRNLIGMRMVRLAGMGRHDSAWAAYRAASGRRETGSSSAVGEFAEGGLPPFDWTYSEEPGLNPERRPRPGQSGAAALYLPAASGGGQVARRLLRLPPGGHVLTAMVGEVGGDAARRPSLTLTCATGDAEILESDFPPAGPDGARMEASFSVPPGCRFQWISISVRPIMDGDVGSAPWIAELNIR